MSHKLPNYLKTHRKRSRLSQDHVAFLLGYRSGTRVSRYERLMRMPPLRTALAYEVIFHKPIRELFAGVYEGVEKKIERRKRLLAARLDKMRQSSRSSRPSRRTLAAEPPNKV